MADGKITTELQAKDKINGLSWGLAHHPGVAGEQRSSGVAGGERSSTPAGGFWIALAGGGGGGWLYFFKDNEKSEKATEFFKLKLPTDGRDLALSPDKTQVAVAHADKTLRLYTLSAKPA